MEGHEGSRGPLPLRNVLSTFSHNYLEMFSCLRSPILKNTGSTARDHLASERTFLAWLRTGLGFVALGIAVERFGRFELAPPLPPQSADKRNSSDQEDRSQGLVLGLLTIGSGSIAYGTGRYFSNRRMLERGLYEAEFLWRWGVEYGCRWGDGGGVLGDCGESAEGEGLRSALRELVGEKICVAEQTLSTQQTLHLPYQRFLILCFAASLNVRCAWK